MSKLWDELIYSYLSILEKKYLVGATIRYTRRLIIGAGVHDILLWVPNRYLSMSNLVSNKPGTKLSNVIWVSIAHRGCSSPFNIHFNGIEDSIRFYCFMRTELKIDAIFQATENIRGQKQTAFSQTNTFMIYLVLVLFLLYENNICILVFKMEMSCFYSPEGHQWYK